MGSYIPAIPDSFDSLTIEDLTIGNELTLPIVDRPLVTIELNTFNTLTDQAAALQFFANNSTFCFPMDLTKYSQARLIVGRVTTAGFAGSTLKVRWRALTAFSGVPADWSALSLPEAQVTIDAIGARDSGWNTIDPTAKQDVLLAFLQEGGDAVADPAISHAAVFFR